MQRLVCSVCVHPRLTLPKRTSKHTARLAGNSRQAPPRARCPQGSRWNYIHTILTERYQKKRTLYPEQMARCLKLPVTINVSFSRTYFRCATLRSPACPLNTTAGISNIENPNPIATAENKMMYLCTPHVIDNSCVVMRPNSSGLEQ